MQIDPGFFAKLRGDYSLRSGQVGVNFDEYRRVVAGDLEDLLNTKNFPKGDFFDGLPFASKSLLTFGVGDLSGLYFENSLDVEAACQLISRCVSLHEPRLKNVQVNPSNAIRAVGGLALNIEAILVAPGVQESVQFSALLDVVTKKYLVSSSR